MPDYEFDMKGLREVQDASEQARINGQARMEKWGEIKEMVFMDWSTKPVDDNLKVTVSPGPRNKIIGLRNLLASTSPQFNVPRDQNDPESVRVSSALEHGANKLWVQSNRVQGKRIEADMVISASMFDEIHLDIISTNDKLKTLKQAYQEAKEMDEYVDEWDGPRWKARIRKAERIAYRTPYLFKVENPEAIYPIWSTDGDGLIARYKEVVMLVSDVRNRYGDRAIEPLSSYDGDEYDYVTVCEWVDEAYRYTWLQDSDTTPIFAETHGLDFFPGVSYRVQGSGMFTETEHTNEPFLYSVKESGIWQAQNTILTAIRTAMNAIGLNAQMYYKKAHPDDTLGPVDHASLAGVIEGEGDLKSMMTDIVTRDVQSLWGMLEGMFEESTIYGSALGEKLSNTSTFSETALLAQQGRLPVVPIQKAMQEASAQAMQIACLWMKNDGNIYESMFGDLQAKDIPEFVEFEVQVEPDLPQDKIQAGSIASTLVQAGLVSKEWGRNLLGEGQSDDMQKQIYAEQMSDKAFQATSDQVLQQAQQLAQQIQSMMNPPEPEQPPQGMPPEMAGQTPQDMPQMPPGGPEQGANEQGVPQMQGMMQQPRTMPPGQTDQMMPPNPNEVQ